MARRVNAEGALRARKEAKQKKLLIGLAPILLALIVWQGPGMVKAFTGGDAPPEPPPPAATEDAPEMTPQTTPDPTSGAAPSTVTAPQEATAPTAAGELPDTDQPLPADAGELVAFDRFIGKDPFRQQVHVPTADDSGGGLYASADDGDASTGGGEEPAQGAGSDTGSGTGFTQPSPPPSTGGSGGGVSQPAPRTVLVAVNGTREALSVAAEFPAADPFLRLVSVRRKGAKVALVSGAFSTGGSKLTLRLRKPVTLVSQPDGLRYRITLLRVGVPTD